MDTGYKWQRVKARLAEDILNGKLDFDGRLPPLKILTQVYNTSRRPLLKAIESLKAEGFFTSRQGLSQSGGKAPGPRPVILFFGAYVRDIAHANYDINKFVRVMEIDCADAGIQLVLLDYEELTKTTIKDYYDNEIIFGAIVWFNASFRNIIYSTLAELDRYKPPIALVNNSIASSLKISYTSRVTLAIFQTESGSISGSKTASTLIKMGHRHIAYKHFCGQYGVYSVLL